MVGSHQVGYNNVAVKRRVVRFCIAVVHFSGM